MAIVHDSSPETLRKLLDAAEKKGHHKRVVRIVQDGVEVPDDVAKAARVKADPSEDAKSDSEDS